MCPGRADTHEKALGQVQVVLKPGTREGWGGLPAEGQATGPTPTRANVWGGMNFVSK